ncbi:SDR family NAD(P)-dependent oxidoreductase [Streptomyces sp. NRRL B-3648]|uniref:SDR family NAD(P)-dependent oxidoreductase n=1 Tax=Streptomyces sp. NRRL B-3648 TaxID=1519493 RepID=UPI001F4521A0|nr:SDR family NAD(P)-dependent oxidoreductase [Streptomyces sp. NRRL B-3648]
MTGASSGVGRDTAHALADDGHDVVVHVRNPSRLTGADDTARWKGVVTGDLGEVDQIRDVARQAGASGRFDAVIHDAGALHSPDVSTVNTAAPYLLTALMAEPARLGHLSSSLHRTGSTDLRRPADGTASYDDSKLWGTRSPARTAGKEPRATRSTRCRTVRPGSPAASRAYASGRTRTRPARTRPRLAGVTSPA